MADTDSLWQATRTFFPLFQRQAALAHARKIAIVGAADGKFVLPFARAGCTVTAIECDKLALDGAIQTQPGGSEMVIPGLRQRLKTEGLTDQVTVITADLLDLTDELELHDALWTSCSWHYSRNHTRPLKDFLDAFTALCTPAGLLGAEYMMPSEPKHDRIEHYLGEGQIRAYLPGWSPIWETYTPLFEEDPHPGQPRRHQHRMGLFIGRRTPHDGATPSVMF